MKKTRPFILLFILIGFAALVLAVHPAQALGPVYDSTPTPPPTPTPTPGGGGSVTTSITEIFYHLVFPAETISEALANIFNKAVETEVNAMSEEVARWTSVIGEIIQAPSQGDYSKVAQSSLPVAAALAPALFLLRLALYHWGRLLGDDDTGLRVVGDWVTAGALAVAAGPLLDLVVQLGWWMVGKVIGETAALAVEFVQSTTATSVALGLANLTFLGSLITIALALGSLVAIGGLLFAFAAANAVLFILAVLGPPLAIASVLPQVTWLRSLWLKAVIVIALLPVVAGGVFKAGLAASTFLGQQGLLSAVIRVIWLWGATGLLISIAGILGKMTITTTADAVGQLFQAVKQVASVAALAASGAGAAGGVGAAGGGATGSEAALGHLGSAQQLTQRAGIFEALGLKNPAAYNRSLAHEHELAARQAELGERMQRFDGVQSQQTQAQTQSADYGFSPTVNSAIQSNFSGSREDFQRGFEGLSPHISAQGFDPNAFAAQYPEATAHMVQAYNERPDEINSAQNPLYRAAQLGNAGQIEQMLTFRSNQDNNA
ncbi:MAG TPA: hypothetical protein PLN86_04615 [Candidatus Hydrogenedentes bacterium]|nr:hypothetical protein [Candidatus Hydrogenedentota bacterium]